MTRKYDPMAHGARCDICPLRDCTPVPPDPGQVSDMELLAGTAIAIVGEAPGEQEERQGRPFVGPSGQELDKALRMAGIKRRNVHVSNALLCLSGDTKVRLADGKLERINKLVKDRYAGEVLSVDEAGNVVTRRVTGWHRNDRHGRRMFKLSTAGAKKNSRGVVGPLLTEDHPVMTRRGWVAVSELRETDWVAVGDKALGEAGRDVVFGSLLGDGSIARRGLVITHAESQQEWLAIKGRTLAPLGFTLRTAETPDGWETRHELRTRPSRWFLQLKQQFEARDFVLTPRILAVWWLDDGYLRERENRRPAGEINQTKLDEAMLNWLMAQARKLGIEMRRNDRRLYIPPDSMIALSRLIAPFVPLSMEYKLVAECRGQFSSDLWVCGSLRHCWDRPVLTEVEPRQQDRLVYCIDVEGTHNFLTSDAVVHNCRPPGNKLRDFLTQIKRRNREAEKAAKAAGADPPEPIPSPLDCCAPRLQDEIAPFQRFITLGKTGTQAVTGITASIMAIRGGLTELDPTDRTPGRQVMPTVHPAFVLRQQRWAHVFRNDVAKAGRWFAGRAEWDPPEIIYHPKPDMLRAFLSDPTKIYTFDLETDGIESLTAKIRCVGIGFEDKVVVIGFLGKDGYTRFYPPHEEEEVRQILIELFANPNIVKAGHNAGYYDKIVLQQQWGVTATPIIDTMLLHRNVESELPHGLAYVGSMYTEAPSWKTDREGNKLSHDSETDFQLHEYCGFDVGVTARVLPPLAAQVNLRQQTGVWQVDQKMQAICADMHTVGMYVDQEKRAAEEKRLLARRFELLNEIRDLLGNPTFNPGSVFQMRDILFDKWQLSAPLEDKDRLTSSGDPSTADLVLRSLLTDRSVKPDQRHIIKLVRYYRKVQKVLGTYVVKLRPWDMEVDDDLGWDDDEDWVDKETRKKYGLAKKGIVDPRTGRMHPGYNAHVAVTGRLSSSKPINAQNFPKAMRGMIIAQPGHVLVGADMDQLELRIAAARWGVQLYLRAFASGKDPHSMTAFAVFGDAFLKATGLTKDQFERPGKLVSPSFVDGKFEGTGDDKKMRDLSKAVQYASQYMAKVETVHQLICKTEVPAKGPNGEKMSDGTTDLPYALMPLRRVREMRDNWLKGAPEFAKGWDKEIDTYRRQGFLTEDVTGRRRDFLDGEAPNEIVNFPIQSSAAGLMNRAIIQLHEAIPLHKWGPGTGIVNQCHDSIVVECPESEAKNVAGLLEECMNQTHSALPDVVFSASASIGTTWKQVG